MDVVVEKVTVEHQTEVAAIVDTIKRVRTLTGKKQHSLRINIHQFKHCRGEGILHAVAVLEVPQTDVKGIVVGEAVVKIILLHHTREIVHEKE